MISRVKYGLKIEIYEMRKITLKFSTDMDDRISEKKVCVERREGDWSDVLKLARGHGL